MKKLYVLVGLIALLCSLVVMTPARDVYGWFHGKVPSNVHVYQINGTLLHGTAGMIRINNRIDIHDVRWDIHPLALLTGALSADLTGHLAGGQTSANAHIGFGGGITLHNVVSTATIAGLKPIIDVGFLPVRGQIGIRMQELSLDNGHLTDAHGYVTVGELAWTLTQPGVKLGAYRADLSTDKSGITAILQNTQSPVELTGRCALTPKSTWKAHLKLRAKPDANPDVKDLLSNIGRKNPQGWYTVQQSGHI